MNVRDAAKALEVSEALIYELCEARQLGHVRIGKGRGVIRISAEDIAAYLRARRVEPVPPDDGSRVTPVPRAQRISAQATNYFDRNRAEKAARKAGR